MNPDVMHGQGQLVPCSLKKGRRYARDGTVSSTYKQVAYSAPGGGYIQHEIGRKYDPYGKVRETYKSVHFMSNCLLLDKMLQPFKHLPGLTSDDEED